MSRPDDAPAIDLRGAKVRLRTTVDGDRSALVTIRSTPAVQERWRGEDLEAEFDAALDDDESHQLTIEGLVSGAIVGMIQFAEEDDPDYRHASLDIYLDPAAHGRGFASDAIRTLVSHLVEDRGHHRLTIDPAADNEPAIRCYSAAGFLPVGVMRCYERQADGSWADGLLMELVVGNRDEAVVGCDPPTVGLRRTAPPA